MLLPLKAESGFRRLRGSIGSRNIRQQFSQAVERFIGRIADRVGGCEMFQSIADFQNRTDLLLAEHAAAVLHDRDERAEIPSAAVIRDERALPRTDLHKPLLRKLGQAAVHNGAADLHLPRKFPLGRELRSDGEFTGQNHSLKLLHKQIFETGR